MDSDGSWDDDGLSIARPIKENVDGLTQREVSTKERQSSDNDYDNDNYIESDGDNEGDDDDNDNDTAWNGKNISQPEKSINTDRNYVNSHTDISIQAAKPNVKQQADVTTANMSVENTASGLGHTIPVETEKERRKRLKRAKAERNRQRRKEKARQRKLEGLKFLFFR